MSERTSIYLIGVGPGDPGLLTVRGRARIEAADVIVHDDNVPAAILKHARPDAEVIGVGTATPEPMAQAAIGYLLADKAREGRTVARLMWGDPFVFDHGGEEALYLHEQGVSFEVIPGVPAGVAVPAYAGIPVTYAGGGDTFTIVRPFEDDRRTLSGAQWSSLARLDGTVVCYVSAHQIARLLDDLTSHGWPPLAAGALVYHGTTPAQQTIEGTLSELADYVRTHPRRGPAILIVGRVVGFREHLRWFDTKPLFGVRVLVTRPREQATELMNRLTALGAEAVAAPMIRIMPPADAAPLRRVTAQVADFDWIVFTSVNAVEAFMRALLETHRDVRALSGPRICAIGSSTAERFARFGIRVDLIPDEFHAEGLLDALTRQGPLAGTRVLLPHADIARELLAEQLRAAGADVTEVVAYRTVTDESLRDAAGTDIYRMLLEHQIDVVTFTSPSAVRAFATVFGEDQTADLLAHTVVASIGPVTAHAAHRLGIEVAVQPPVHTAAALADALAAHFSERARRFAET